MENIVNSKLYADTILTLGNYILYSHKAIIDIRCPSLLSLFLKEKPSKKGNITTYRLDEKICDEISIYSILSYLYTDSLQFSNLSPVDVVNIIRLSELYGIERLIWLCERYLRLVITHGMWIYLFYLT